MDINELPALDWNLSMKCVQAMLGCTSGELECIGEKALDGYVKDVQRVAAVLADRERQAGEAVAWFRVENGIRVYYETKAWDDLTPLFASTPAPQVVQAEPDMEKIRRDAVSNAMMTCMKGVTDAYRYFPAQGKDVEDFDRCAAEAMTKAVEFAVQLTAREVRDPVWPYAAAPSPDGKAEQAEAPKCETCRRPVHLGRCADASRVATQPTASNAGEQEIHHSELLIEMWPPRPTKGMLVGMSKGVKITHRPTGTIATCDSERSQHLNRDKALEQLRAALATKPPAGEQKPSTPQAFQTLKAAIQADEMYAWSWHCVAWSCAFDEGLETGAANRAAARFMSMAFDTDTSKHPHFNPEHQHASPAPQAAQAEQAEAPSDADPLTPEQEEWVMDLAEKHNLGRRVPQIGAMRGVAPDVFYTDASYRTHELFCFAAALLSTKELT